MVQVQGFTLAFSRAVLWRRAKRGLTAAIGHPLNEKIKQLFTEKDVFKRQSRQLLDPYDISLFHEISQSSIPVP
jgi:hypothetical protein